VQKKKYLNNSTRMKAILYILLLSAANWAYSQRKLVVNGIALNLKNGTEISLDKILPRRLADLKQTTTTTIKDHHFKFILPLDDAELYFMWANQHGKRLFLEPGNANINIADSNLIKVTVTENVTALEYEKYDALLNNVSLIREYGIARRDYDIYMHTANTDIVLANNKMQKRDSLLEKLNMELLAIRLNWIKDYPNSYINTNVLYDLLGSMSETELKKVFYSMPTDVTRNTWGQELKYRIDSLFIGGTAPNFLQSDTGGRRVSLSNFRGKYVLLDFWASWCVPCRAENPSVVKALQKFKDKNLIVIGVSLDEKKDAWLTAIKQDKLNWTHLSDLQGWKNPISVSYCVPLIPTNYLIDPNGRIVDKDLHGNDLMTTLNKLIK
jgi:peroxiredoxin